MLYDETSTTDRVAACRIEAERWAEAHGLELRADDMRPISDVPGVTLHGAYKGVEFDVVVGKAFIDPNQGVPGVLDNWTWSARVEFWRHFLGRFAGGRQGRRLTELRKSDHGRVVQFPLAPPRMAGSLDDNEGQCTDDD